MELRPLTLGDDPALDRLMSEAFAGGRRPDSDKPKETNQERSSRTTGVFDGVRLVAAETVHDLRLVWGDIGEMPMGGVAGVACATDQRGRGHVAALLAESLTAMRESGQFLSGLYPFAWAFYRRFGWEWVGEKRTFIVPTAEIRASPEGRNIRVYDGPDALEIVKPVYAAFARRYRGMTTRETKSPNFWERLDHRDNKTTYVHVHHDAETGAADGYLTFRYGDNPAMCRDFFANSPAAYKGLLSVLHYYGTQVKTVGWDAPADDPLPLHVMHHDLQTSAFPLFMGRVVDVTPALAALKPPADLAGTVILKVADGHCDWNDGTFAVKIESGHVTAAPSNAEPGVALDIQAFTQAYWGQPSLDRLRAAGRLDVSDEASFALLSALLPPAVCFLADFF